MSSTIDQAFIKFYETEVQEAYQRHGSKLRPTVDFLVRVGVPEQRVGQVVSKKPQLLGYSIATKLLPAVLFLQHEVRAAPWRGAAWLQL